MNRRLLAPERLEALERSGLLTKPVAERIQHLAYTAAVLLKVDATQVNILGGTTQHTLAQWPTPPAADMPTTDSACYQVFLDRSGTLAVDEGRDHPAMCTMPWVGTFRSFLGTMVLFDGQRVASVCALTVAPRIWTPQDSVTIQGVAQLLSEAVLE